jgi:uncharacterized phage protein (TIGR02218 family)
MPFNTLESGTQTGAPVELYEFRRGPNFYRYTSADADITFNTKVFEAVAMTRNAIEATAEVARNPIKITCGQTLGVVQLFLAGPPGDVVTLTVYRIHRGDTEAVTIWMGRVLNVNWSGSTATIHCESVYSSIKRPGLRRMYQKQCPHVLYSAACGVSSSTFRHTTTVLGVSGVTITLDNMGAFAANHFAGGYVEWEESTGLFERRAINANTGAVITISHQLLGLPSGATVRLYPGCDHVLATCNSKFSNAVNFGGFPWIPQKNPFGGIDGPIY